MLASFYLNLHATAMFLEAKRREEGHDFYTEGFPATIQFIRDQLAEVCREADFKTCACLFTSYRRYLLPTADDQAF